LSGAINEEAVLRIRATRVPADSRYAWVVRVIEDAERKRPPMRRVADRLGAWYTPLVLTIAGGAWLAGGTPERFLAVLVIATPCPLLIVIPVVIIGGISLAAKRGIVIRNPAALEQLDCCRTSIFDKTGTLTYGRPLLAEIVCLRSSMNSLYSGRRPAWSNIRAIHLHKRFSIPQRLEKWRCSK
jgi:P-type E1-E2 ATPase